MTEEIEIPLGAFDSETIGWTYTIPEGFTAKIEDGKIIVEKMESDDDRIRKFISETVFRSYGDSQEYLDVLAYLEKQKDLKYTEEHMEDIRQYAYNKGIVDAEEKQKEQKPAEWSEQDKMHLNNAILAAIKEWGAGSLTVKFLNSLRPQPKQEWSEEDKDKVAQYLHDKDGGMLWSKATEIAEDILGMIRPQPHWKPSERQMRDLATLAKQNEGNSLGNDLISLYNDLKKL